MLRPAWAGLVGSSQLAATKHLLSGGGCEQGGVWQEPGGYTQPADAKGKLGKGQLTPALAARPCRTALSKNWADTKFHSKPKAISINRSPFAGASFTLQLAAHRYSTDDRTPQYL